MYERFAVSGSMLAGVLLLSFVAAIVLSARLQRYVSRPVLALADTAQIVTREHDYSIRATRFGDDELGRLTDSFNTMLAHVQEQDASLRLQSEQLRHEVAERARAEEEVRAFNATLERRVEQRTKEVEAINKELEAFSYSVSHDLRAPLRHVVGFVEMLEQDLGDEVPERARRYMATIRKASVEMGQLIDDLLKFSRMSRSEMRNDVVPLDALVRAIASHLESTAGPRTIEWLVEPLPLVVGDSGLLKQVFVNLLDNAVKYSRGRDPARITVGSLIGEQGELVLFVRDNGAGFDMRYAQKLFGVFQRLHRPEEFEGTGIGLATVQRIIVRHGGRIWYESAVGEGTTFYFTLERAAVPAPQETEA